MRLSTYHKFVVQIIFNSSIAMLVTKVIGGPEALQEMTFPLTILSACASGKWLEFKLTNNDTTKST